MRGMNLRLFRDLLKITDCMQYFTTSRALYTDSFINSHTLHKSSYLQATLRFDIKSHGETAYSLR